MANRMCRLRQLDRMNFICEPITIQPTDAILLNILFNSVGEEDDETSERIIKRVQLAREAYIKEMDEFQRGIVESEHSI